ncbi:UvrD-helicase domain-containing protein [Heliobacterium mobile]|uniref:UvrD-helicase domain-containing protein n=1 Tax=Heliobacterium mobile TaxID=28064 RepID=UPI001478EA92|nr:UvrD-helicase domain-containing protein [Heliobacterium mobile]
MNYAILDGLNKEQKQAVLHTEGATVIFAGAGTGKTLTICKRIAFLIAEKKVHPKQIIAITFTNKAAREMKERVEKLTGLTSADIWISTFHSACAKILRRYATKLGYTSNFTILDKSDQLKAIGIVVKSMDIEQETLRQLSLDKDIERAKNQLILPPAYPIKNNLDMVTASIYAKYQEYLFKHNLMDFNDLLFLCVLLFHKMPDVLEYYQNQLRYVFVDEYQDTNYAQFLFTKMLAQKSNNICVVGDDDQSIYSWRGADIRNILEFNKHFPHTKTILLEQNYRSTQTILNAANAVIANNKTRQRKALRTQNEIGHKIQFNRYSDNYAESEDIVNTVRSLQKAELLTYNDFAVLYRFNFMSRSVETTLTAAKIPYRILNGLRYWDRKEVKDLMAYLRILNNPLDDISILRVLNVPKRRIGEITQNKLEQLAQSQNTDLWSILKNIEQYMEFRQTAPNIRMFVNLIEELQYFNKQNRSVEKLVQTVVKKSNYLSDFTNQEEREERHGNLIELAKVGAEYDTSNPEGDLNDFINKMTLIQDQSEDTNNDDAVSLTTIHSAKGLEFTNVFVIGMDDSFPSHNRQSVFELEEERRLCYVALTRAKKRLFLSMVMPHPYKNPSPFINEIPSEFIVFRDKKSDEFETHTLDPHQRNIPFTFDDFLSMFNNDPPNDQGKSIKNLPRSINNNSSDYCDEDDLDFASSFLQKALEELDNDTLDYSDNDDAPSIINDDLPDDDEDDLTDILENNSIQDVSEQTCELCGAHLVVEIKFFYSIMKCTRFPECSFTKLIR